MMSAQGYVDHARRLAGGLEPIPADRDAGGENLPSWQTRRSAIIDRWLAWSGALQSAGLLWVGVESHANGVRKTITQLATEVDALADPEARRLGNQIIAAGYSSIEAATLAAQEYASTPTEV